MFAQIISSPLQLSGFVCAFYPAALGLNPNRAKHLCSTLWREKRKKSYANLLITLTKKVRVKLIVKNCLRLLFGKEQNGSRWGAICKKYLKTGRGISNYSQINGFELCYHWEKRQNESKRGRERVLKLWSCRTLILVFSI